MSDTLPEATQRPCNECPWRRESAPGWLGPFDADDWLMLAHSDLPIACHQTIVTDGSFEPGSAPGPRRTAPTCARARVTRR